MIVVVGVQAGVLVIFIKYTHTHTHTAAVGQPSAHWSSALLLWGWNIPALTSCWAIWSSLSLSVCVEKDSSNSNRESERVQGKERTQWDEWGSLTTNFTGTWRFEYVLWLRGVHASVRLGQKDSETLLFFPVLLHFAPASNGGPRADLPSRECVSLLVCPAASSFCPPVKGKKLRRVLAHRGVLWEEALPLKVTVWKVHVYSLHETPLSALQTSHMRRKCKMPSVKMTFVLFGNARRCFPLQTKACKRFSNKLDFTVNCLMAA